MDDWVRTFLLQLTFFLLDIPTSVLGFVSAEYTLSAVWGSAVPAVFAGVLPQSLVCMVRGILRSLLIIIYTLAVFTGVLPQSLTSMVRRILRSLLIIIYSCCLYRGAYSIP